MYRYLDDVFSSWYRKPIRRPIFLDGALSVGKTHLALKAAKGLFKENYLLLDCANGEQPMEKLFTKNENIGGMLGAIEQREGRKIDFGKTLLIIDNIDRIPIAFKAVRDLTQQQPALHIITIGKLNEEIEKLYKWIPYSFDTHRVFPMCFAEFLIANDRLDLAEVVKKAPPHLARELHNQIAEEFRSYLLVGGMPEAVQSWINDRNIQKVRKIQNSIVAKILKIESDTGLSSEIIHGILRYVARNAGNPIDYQELSSSVPQLTVKRILDSLEYQGLVYRVNSSMPTTAPTVNFKVKKFKTIFLDIGLLEVISGLATSLDTQGPDSISMFENALFDQFIGQELLPTQNCQVQYWASAVKGSTARVNYLIRSSHGACPGVIAHENPKFNDHALDICLGSYPECQKAFIFYSDDKRMSGNDKFINYPLYYAMSVGGGYNPCNTVQKVVDTQ